jgi:hypothetical protein
LKVTPRGRDYLQAIILLGILALILDVNALLALDLTLAIVALISFLIVQSVSKFNTKLTFESSRLSSFKGEQVRTKVSVQLKRARWINASVRSVDPPAGIESSFSVVDENTISVAMKTKYAGRFEKFLLHLQVTDIFNLFSKEIAAVYADFCFDSLPGSLLAPIPKSKPMPMTLGDRSLHSSGSSLELYALDQYHPYDETKNVLWKRVARMPDERLIVRIRESSIPKSIQIGFLQITDRFEDLAQPGAKEDEKEAKNAAELIWKDRVCEGLGAVGNNILALGCEINIIHTAKGSGRRPFETDVEPAADLGDLSQAIMNIWGDPANGENNENLFAVLDQCDLVVCGMRDLGDSEVALAIARKPCLLILEEWTIPELIGREALIYSGIEDVKRLVAKLVER